MPGIQRRTFSHRIVRCLALVCLASGIASLINFLADGIRKASIGQPVLGAVASAEWTLSVMGLILAVVLTIGAVGLLAWSAWGRKMLLVWAFLTTAYAVYVEAYVWVTIYARQLAKLQPNGPSMIPYLSFYQTESISYLLNLFSGFTHELVLPLIAIYVLMQRDVAQIFLQPESAFEVLPVKPVEFGNH